MAVKSYSSVAKRLKLNVRKFGGLFTVFGEVTGRKTRRNEGALCYQY